MWVYWKISLRRSLFPFVYIYAHGIVASINHWSHFFMLVPPNGKVCASTLREQASSLYSQVAWRSPKLGASKCCVHVHEVKCGEMKRYFRKWVYVNIETFMHKGHKITTTNGLVYKRHKKHLYECISINLSFLMALYHHVES